MMVFCDESGAICICLDHILVLEIELDGAYVLAQLALAEDSVVVALRARVHRGAAVLEQLVGRLES